MSQFKRPAGQLNLGIRVIPANNVHKLLARCVAGQKPTLAEVEALCPGAPYGWTLEHFVADLLLGCVEGSVFKDISEQRIQDLFYRRSGPISAAIAISIEAPE